MLRYLRLLSSFFEKAIIRQLDNTSTLDRYLDHKHSWKVINKFEF